MIRLRGWNESEPRVRVAVRSFTRWAQLHLEIKHEIHVRRAQPIVGLFSAPDRRCDERVFTIDVVDTNRVRDVIDTYAHELVHYEQWRDGREVNERGVGRRAAALERRWARERA